ncbi:hypothetical protein FAUST_4157 [Fusarium austroamericanum]|uniref:Thioredoxin n=1 Tax=Fusarium austroamericanum TaxID=282268 RepID=A0AAN6HH63_FUSAU|nr:hypothetical protein FAUST_4157 [Fusarium austroamericanum]
MSIVQIDTKAQFDELLKSHKVVIIDASAQWCGPCKAISPIFHRLSADESYDREKVVFAKFDTDDVPDLAQELAVRSIPAFFFFRDGEQVNTMAGANPGGLTKLVTQAIEASKE